MRADSRLGRHSFSVPDQPVPATARIRALSAADSRHGVGEKQRKRLTGKRNGVARRHPSSRDAAPQQRRRIRERPGTDSPSSGSSRRHEGHDVRPRGEASTQGRRFSLELARVAPMSVSRFFGSLSDLSARRTAAQDQKRDSVAEGLPVLRNDLSAVSKSALARARPSGSQTRCTYRSGTTDCIPHTAGTVGRSSGYGFASSTVGGTWSSVNSFCSRQYSTESNDHDPLL
jgi:hypothetical protein